jgi:hypothetical protein
VPLLLSLTLYLLATPGLNLLAILPFLGITTLFINAIKYDTQPYPTNKFIINILAWLLLVGSIMLMIFNEGILIQEMFNGIIPLITILLFTFISFCYLINNFKGLLKGVNK